MDDKKWTSGIGKRFDLSSHLCYVSEWLAGQSGCWTLLWSKWNYGAIFASKLCGNRSTLCFLMLLLLAWKMTKTKAAGLSPGNCMLYPWWWSNHLGHRPELLRISAHPSHGPPLQELLLSLPHIHILPVNILQTCSGDLSYRATALPLVQPSFSIGSGFCFYFWILLPGENGAMIA